ncbi:hypothetical protein GC093_07555 [Paenibacillus sp. LMG 31456]|uniref:Uncharacterized protein n=1 Tax=Paenibacillus foliorum TaxID=2654974 RepID=A0A972GRF8_9BACL|nr:hypothetical protein [Paenibacillus foliorum]NOU93089.1 hypothetical protein [Paenibacillus foliorum]
MRHHGNFENVFPSYLRDYYAIDFSNDDQFDRKFEELVHRIYRHNSFEKAPLGSMPSFISANKQQHPTMTEKKMHPIKNDNIFESFSSLTIPKSFTDLDKEEFLRSSYDELKQRFTQLFDHVKTQTAGFTYQLDEENNKKLIYKLYIHGQHKTSLKMLIGGFSYSSPTINFAFGSNHSIFNDNSYNEMISIEETDNQLALKMLMGLRNNNSLVNPVDIVKRIWEDHVLPYLKN